LKVIEPTPNLLRRTTEWWQESSPRCSEVRAKPGVLKAFWTDRPAPLHELFASCPAGTASWLGGHPAAFIYSLAGRSRDRHSKDRIFVVTVPPGLPVLSRCSGGCATFHPRLLSSAPPGLSDMTHKF